jgi:glycine cleavage system H protein
MSYPNSYRYSKEHEWISVTDDYAVVGITQFAQTELGEIVYVELPEVGTVVVQGEEIGSLESVKAVAEVYSPVSGEIIEINEILADTPEMVNENPHESGWLVKIRLSNQAEVSDLLTPDQYVAYLAEET